MISKWFYRLFFIIAIVPALVFEILMVVCSLCLYNPLRANKGPLVFMNKIFKKL